MNLPLFVLNIVVQASSQLQPSCDSKIYCQGDLVDTVQMARIFNDSKTFVDMKLVNDEDATLKAFEVFLNATGREPSREEVRKFVGENFEKFDEFEDWIPVDFTPTPRLLQKIKDEKIRSFAGDLVNIWPKLARKIKQEVKENGELFTLVPVDNGFVVPGGRFREFYYWDSFWIIRGLLLSDMHATVRGMLDNFVSIIDRFGFVPNGARIYYLNRSQPPLLTFMVAEYLKATNDTRWLAENIRSLDKELLFWLENRVIEVKRDGVAYDLAHYDVESGSPRPESYYEDVKTAGFVPSEKDKLELYEDLKSGAESGWDFSSRWIVDAHGGIDANLSSLHTRRIIPVDLNAYLCRAFALLSQFYAITGDFYNALYWRQKSKIWLTAVQEVFYDEEDGIWYDWDSELSQPRKLFFPSNFAPLWTQSYDPADGNDLGERAANYLLNQGLLEYEGGIPCSLSHTGEQWDYPNAWPPLQSIVIFGLDSTGNSKAQKIAKEFAFRWINANLIGFEQSGEMYEKYDARYPGKYGGGGEYVPQAGFGWTNGVALELIDKYCTSDADPR